MVAAWVRRMNLAKLREREEVRGDVLFIRLFIRTVFATNSCWMGSEMTQVARRQDKRWGRPCSHSFPISATDRQCLNDCFPGTSEVHSPASLVSPGEPLDGDGGVALAQVLLARQPASDGFLDADAGGAQLVRSQLLQVGNLACPEEDFGLAKLIFILVLRERKEQRLEISIIH